MPGRIGARVPEILADLSAVIGEKTRRGVPNSDLARRFWRSLGDLRPTCTGFRRKPWLASCRNAGGTDLFEYSRARCLMTVGLLRCCRHTTPKRQAPQQNPAQIGELLGESGTRRQARAFFGTTRRDDTHNNGREGSERFRQALENKPVGTRCHRLLEGETHRLVQGRPSVGVRVGGTACSGDGGVPGEEDSSCCGATRANRRHGARLGHRSGSQVNQRHPLAHALSRTFKRVYRSATRTKAELPSTPKGTSEWRFWSRGGGLRDATYAIGVSQQSDTARRHVRRLLR